MYKKSYKLFIIWMLLVCIGPFAFCFCPWPNDILVRAVNLFIVDLTVLLTVIIYVTDSIYWYNGISFEQAEEAGFERRKKCAMQHMKRFLIVGVSSTILTVICGVLGISYWIDMVYSWVAIIVAAISTMNIKL